MFHLWMLWVKQWKSFMNNSLTEAIREAFVLAPSGQVILSTLEITQGSVQSPVYLVQSRLALTALDENGVEKTYEPSGFQFTLPPSTEEGFQSLNIAIDNIGQRLTDFVKAAKSQRVPVIVYYRPYLSTDLSTPQMVPPLVLYLRDLQLNTMQVTGRATFMDVVNKKFPLTLYTREIFPGLG